MKDITPKDVIREYIKTRKELEALADEYEESVKELKKVQLAREDWLKGELLKQDVESFKTDEGTAFVQVSETCKVDDWDAVLGFLFEPFVDAIISEYWEVETEEEKAEVKNDLFNILKEKGGLEYLEKKINKLPCLEYMGEYVKGKGRPNSPPKGISYTAFKVVRVRKA